MLEPIRAFCRNKPVWGICAGLILLADKLEVTETDGWVKGDQPLIGGLDCCVTRNFFGRQSDSRFRQMMLQEQASGLGCGAYFIRAPAMTTVGPSCTVLATTLDGVAVAGMQGNLLATCFHPEISHDDSWLQFFLQRLVGLEPGLGAEPIPDPESTAPWHPTPRGDDVLDTGVKRAFMVFQQGGVIMDVVNAAQARIAEEAGAVSVMALERIPADIKKDGLVDVHTGMTSSVFDCFQFPHQTAFPQHIQ